MRRPKQTPSLTVPGKFLFSLLAGVIGLINGYSQLPAFPGAEGAGAYAVGGRYGDVYHVTTLSSSATTPGSFYYGIANAPAAGRTMVFDLSGYIHLSGTYTMNKSKITLAGQTAPGEGIGFKDGTFNISATDVIIRHIRFRDGNSADAADLDSAVNRCIMDHCDVMLSNDENLSSFGSPPDNFTFQWCMNSWGMESHSCGGLWDQNHATCHHSLWSHNHTRNPKARPTLLDWVNNVTFDWDIGFIMGDSDTPANWKANVRGCYFVSPPGNTRSVALEKANLDRNGNPNFSLFLDDSAMDGNGDGVLNVSQTGYALASGSYITSATAFVQNGIPVTRDDYLTAYKKVLSAAGPLRLEANPAVPLRDELNTILVNNVVKQLRHHVSSPAGTGASGGGFGVLNTAPAPADTDRDGMPDFWETALGSNVGMDDHTNAVPAAAFVPTGYTRLEEYLQFLAMPHGSVAKFLAATPTALDVDLHKYTVGFTNKPPVTYTLANVTNGTVILTNGYFAHFVPPTNFFGRARFDFNVTDGDGSAWTQTFAVLVSAAALPRDLKWKGDGTTDLWSTNSLSFLTGTNLTAFSLGDYVTMDDTGSNSPALNLTDTFLPTSLTVNATKNYTLGGSGSLGGAMTLQKSGGGTLTLASANTFSGDVTIDSSTIQLNQNGTLGSGAITFQSGTLVNGWSVNSQPGFANPLVVPAGETGAIYLGNRIALTGNLTGGGTLNLVAQTTVARDDFKGNAGAFTGTVNILGSGSLRMFVNGGAFGGFDNALTTFDSPVHMDFYDNSGGNTFYFGAIAGTNTSAAMGNLQNGTAATLKIGALNLDTTFAGQFQSTANLVKLGTGTFTLSGNSSHTGATTVSNGTLLVTGNFSSSLVTVVNGSALAGTGFLGGGVTILTGGKILPGAGAGSFGALTTSNNLTLNSSATLAFDLSSSPGGVNDKITMQGGLLTMGNPQSYNFNLVNNTLGAGTYNLIDGGTNTSATSVTLLHNLPNGTRQTFAMQRPPSNNGECYVRLAVTGSAASLVWSGTNSSAWDVNTTTNWLNVVAADKFFNLDSARFDDSSTNGAVAISGVVQPVALTVTNPTRAYTIGGGEIAGLGALVKSGAAQLTLTGSNSFYGGTIIKGGTVFLANDTANQFGLGSGNVTLQGGTLTMYSDTTSYNTALWNLIVPTGATSRLNTDARCYLNGTLTGGGTLDFYVPYVRTELDGDWSDFTGRINVLVDGDGGDFRINNSYGYANAAINLAANAVAYHMTASSTVAVGELSGAAGSVLSSANWRVGALNTDSTFAGTIVDGGGITSLTKTGTGALTLTGANTHTGNTTVSAGTLRVNNVSGSGTGAGDVTVAGGATLAGGGSIAGLVTISDGGILAPGNSAGTLKINEGLVLGHGAVLNFELGMVSDQVIITNDLTLGGTLNITGLAGFGVGAYTLFTYGGTLSLGNVTLGTKPPGYNYSISTSTPGQVKLIVAPTTPPNFGSVILSGNNLVFNGGNGTPLGNYIVIGSTNLALPLTNWTRVATNQFDAGGNFNFTNLMDINSPQNFYRLQGP